MKTLQTRDAMRYNRQIMLPAFDLEGQEALLNGHALVVGAGGLGCAAAQYLVSAGIGRLTLVDDDTVEQTNLQRQVLHTEADVGRLKVESAKAQLQQLNSACQIEALSTRLNDQALDEKLSDVQVIVDCSDNLATRLQLNRASIKHGLPLVSGAAIRFEGQLCTFVPGKDAPCYGCFAHVFSEQQLSCVEAGVMGPLVGTIGSLQALEVIKLLSKTGKPATGVLNLFDGMSGQWQQFKLAKHPQCPECGNLSLAAQPD